MLTAVFFLQDYLLAGGWFYNILDGTYFAECSDCRTLRRRYQHFIPKFCACLLQTISDRYLILFLLGIAFLNETHQTVTVFLNQLLYVRAGLSNAAIGYLYIIVTIVGMCGFFPIRLHRKWETVF